MTIPAEIQTERLVLQPPSEADAAEIFERYAHDKLVTRYLSWAPHESVDVTLEFLRTTLRDLAEGKQAVWLIRLRSSKQLIGSIGFGRMGHRSDLGYCLARDAWGLGYATEATRTVADLALSEQPIWRIAALCDVENCSSARVLEKSGFTREGILRRYFKFPNLGDAPRDVYCYSRVRAG